MTDRGAPYVPLANRIPPFIFNGRSNVKFFCELLAAKFA
jgi:hypothetical protein